MKKGFPIKKFLWWEYVLLFPLFFWFIYSIRPFPAFQYSDGFWLWLPRLGFVTQEILRGAIPFWNEFQFCGGPLLADGTTNILNPTTVLYFFLTPPWAYTVGTVVLFFFLILGTWMYFRTRGFSLTASMIGTLGFVFSGQILFWSLYHGMNLSFTLFPWICVAFRLYEKGKHSYWKLLAFILIFLNSLGGFIQFAFLIIVTVFIEGIERFSYDHVKSIMKSRLPTLLLGVVATSIIIVPTIETAIFSHRKLVPYFEGLLPKPLSLVLMTFFGDSKGSHSYWNYFYFVGIVLLALAFFGIRKNFTTIISYPLFWYSLIFPLLLLSVYLKVLPTSFQFGVQSDPFRGMFIFTFVLSLFAAIGSESYLQRLKKRRRPGFPPIELFIGALIAFLCNFRFGSFASVLLRRLCLFIGIMIIAGFIFSFLAKTIRLTFRVRVFIFSLWLVVLMAINSFLPVQVYLEGNVIHESRSIINKWEEKGVAISALANEGRVLHLSSDDSLNGLFEDWGIYWRIRSIGGYGTFFPQSIFMRMRSDGILPPTFTATSHFRNNSVMNTAILAKYGVLYLIDEEASSNLDDDGWQIVNTFSDLLLYKNPKYVGRSYIIDQEDNIVRGGNIIKNTNSYVKILVDAEAGDTLILADSWFPGWICYDNGQKVQGFDANGFRGYKIKTSGQHEVEWVYKPRSFLIGGVLSVVSFIIFLWLIFKKKTHECCKL